MRKVSEKILFKGQWLSLKQGIYHSPDGQEVQWESVERNKDKSSVIVIPLLIPSNRYIIIKQYRFAIDDYVLAFPAGVSDGNPNQALKELKEETGYTGTIIEQSPPVQINAGIVNEKSHVVVVHVDENDPQNKNPIQSLEPGEEIEVILIAKKDAKAFLLKEAEKGARIAAGLWYVLGVDV